MLLPLVTLAIVMACWHLATSHDYRLDSVDEQRMRPSGRLLPISFDPRGPTLDRMSLGPVNISNIAAFVSEEEFWSCVTFKGILILILILILNTYNYTNTNTNTILLCSRASPRKYRECIGRSGGN